jgi:hypothetical protein
MRSSEVGAVLRPSSQRFLALSLPLIGAVALIGCLLWWARNPNAGVVEHSAAYLVGGRTAISAGRPVWICTFAGAAGQFDRTYPVSGGTCPMRVEEPGSR